MTVSRLLVATSSAVLMVSMLGFAQPDKPESTTALRKRGKAALEQLENGFDRDNARTVLALVKRLEEEHKRSEAGHYLEQLTRYAPELLEAKLLYAQHLHAAGKKKDADPIVDELLEKAETDAIRIEALPLAGAAPDLKIPPLTRPEAGKAQVILLPLGRVTKTLLLDVRPALAKNLGIEVVLRQTEFERPEPTAPDPKRAYDTLRESLRFNLKADWNREMIAKARISESDLATDERVVAATRRWLEAFEETSGPEETAKQLRIIDSIVQFATEPKWKAEKLLESVREQIRPFQSEQVVFLAVTDDDIYAKDLDHVYSWTGRDGVGVISFHRFTAARNGEVPSWDRLRTRALKQAICAVGRVLGVTECSNPTCVFSRAGGIDDHDRKRDTPCESCAAEFAKRLPR